MANLDITSMFLVKLVKALSLQLRQIYAGSPLSLVPATKKIFQLTLNSEQSTSVSERQKRHSKVVAIDVANYILHTSCIFTDYLSELLSHLSQKILWKYYKIPCTCVIGVYQALPPKKIENNAVLQSPFTSATPTNWVKLPNQRGNKKTGDGAERDRARHAAETSDQRSKRLRN